MSCPVATLAERMPTTRPRRATNQRVATVAPSTMAVIPVPKPTTNPQSAMRCQACVIVSEATRPAMMIDSAETTTLRRPKRAIMAAANGAIRPNSSSRIDSAEEICVVLQPNSFSSGRMNTPGAPTEAELISEVRNVTATITQP